MYIISTFSEKDYSLEAKVPLLSNMTVFRVVHRSKTKQSFIKSKVYFYIPLYVKLTSYDNGSREPCIDVAEAYPYSPLSFWIHPEK